MARIRASDFVVFTELGTRHRPHFRMLWTLQTGVAAPALPASPQSQATLLPPVSVDVLIPDLSRKCNRTTFAFRDGPLALSMMFSWFIIFYYESTLHPLVMPGIRRRVDIAHLVFPFITWVGNAYFSQ